MATKVVNWFVVELDSLLRDQISADRLASLLREVEVHLTEAIEERRAQGMTPEEAELAAVESMGSPERLATLELRQSGRRDWTGHGQRLAYGGLAFMAVLWFLGSLLPEDQFHGPAGFGLIVGGLTYLMGVGVARFHPWRGMLACAAVMALSLAIHQGTRHVYIGDQELLPSAARAELQALGANPSGVAAERATQLQVALDQPVAARFGARLVPSLVVGVLFASVLGALGEVVSRLRRRGMAHWLRQRLA